MSMNALEYVYEEGEGKGDRKREWIVDSYNGGTWEAQKERKKFIVKSDFVPFLRFVVHCLLHCTNIHPSIHPIVCLHFFASKKFSWFLFTSLLLSSQS